MYQNCNRVYYQGILCIIMHNDYYCHRIFFNNLLCIPFSYRVLTSTSASEQTTPTYFTFSRLFKQCLSQRVWKCSPPWQNQLSRYIFNIGCIVLQGYERSSEKGVLLPSLCNQNISLSIYHFDWNDTGEQFECEKVQNKWFLLIIPALKYLFIMHWIHKKRMDEKGYSCYRLEVVWYIKLGLAIGKAW